MSEHRTLRCVGLWCRSTVRRWPRSSRDGAVHSPEALASFAASSAQSPRGGERSRTGWWPEGPPLFQSLLPSRHFPLQPLFLLVSKRATFPSPGVVLQEVRLASPGLTSPLFPSSLLSRPLLASPLPASPGLSSPLLSWPFLPTPSWGYLIPQVLTQPWVACSTVSDGSLWGNSQPTLHMSGAGLGFPRPIPAW